MEDIEKIITQYREIETGLSDEDWRTADSEHTDDYIAFLTRQAETLVLGEQLNEEQRYKHWRDFLSLYARAMGRIKVADKSDLLEYRFITKKPDLALFRVGHRHKTDKRIHAINNAAAYRCQRMPTALKLLLKYQTLIDRLGVDENVVARFGTFTYKSLRRPDAKFY